MDIACYSLDTRFAQSGNIVNLAAYVHIPPGLYVALEAALILIVELTAPSMKVGSDDRGLY